jgi:hypothetical protein
MARSSTCRWREDRPSQSENESRSSQRFPVFLATSFFDHQHRLGSNIGYLLTVAVECFKIDDRDIEIMQQARFVFDATPVQRKARRGGRVRFKHDLLGEAEGVVTAANGGSYGAGLRHANRAFRGDAQSARP